MIDQMRCLKAVQKSDRRLACGNHTMLLSVTVSMQGFLIVTVNTEPIIFFLGFVIMDSIKVRIKRFVSTSCFLKNYYSALGLLIVQGL